MEEIQFQIEKKMKNALGRAGVLSTPHGEVETPAFVAVGTKATVKSLTPEQVKSTGSQIVLANTYHLYLEPGEKIVKSAGGLHKFMNWPRPTMTDSGGFQAFSLGVAYGNSLTKIRREDWEEAYDGKPKEKNNKPEKLANITEDGVEFKSIIDGSTHFFSPEKSMEIQHAIGADIIFAFDECTSPTASLSYQKESLERTHRWAKRSLEHHKKLLRKSGKSQALFGIVQGGRFPELRKKSARFIGGMDFPGFGIGGSFDKKDIALGVLCVNQILPEEKPRHLLGIGDPLDLLDAVENGCDLFDCVLPTRMGRNGTLWTKAGKIHIENSKFRNDKNPIEKDCECYTCKNYSLSYVAHLFRGREMLAGTLASFHNLYFINSHMAKMRKAIVDGNFPDFKSEFERKYKRP